VLLTPLRPLPPTDVCAANKRVFNVQYTYNYDAPTLAGKVEQFRAEVCQNQTQYGMHSILRDQQLTFSGAPYFDCFA
jgi:hypothetical protein